MCNIGHKGAASTTAGTEATCTQCDNKYQDEVNQPTCKACPDGITQTVPQFKATAIANCGRFDYSSVILWDILLLPGC